MLFNSSFEKFIPLFGYFDEVVCLCIILQATLFGIVKKGLNIFYFFIILLSLYVVISTFNHQYFRGIYISLLDLFLFFKMLFLIPFYLQLTRYESNFVIENIAKVSSLLIYSAIIFLFTFHLLNFPSYDMEWFRFGINSYYFFSHNPGEFGNQILLLFLFTMISNLKKSKKKKILFLVIILLISTMRYKFFGFAFLLIFLIEPLFNNFQSQKISVFKFLKLKYIIICSGLYLIVANQFNHYFFNSDPESVGPRLRFILDSIEIIKNNFPFGIGPGTFGSPIAKLFYSPVYIDLGYNNFYGMSEDETLFLNDNFWPMVLVQYGVIFLVFYIFFFYKILSNFFSKIKFDKTVSLIAVLNLISSTIGASILTGTLGGSFIIFLTIVYNNNRRINSVNE